MSVYYYLLIVRYCATERRRHRAIVVNLVLEAEFAEAALRRSQKDAIAAKNDVRLNLIGS
jgi:hypothetical protein